MASIDIIPPVAMMILDKRLTHYHLPAPVVFKNLCVKQNRTVSCRSRFPRIVLSFSAVCIKQVLTRKSHFFKLCRSHNRLRVNHLTTSYSVGMPITLSIRSMCSAVMCTSVCGSWFFFNQSTTGSYFSFLVTFLYFSICGTISLQDVAASEYHERRYAYV